MRKLFKKLAGLMMGLLVVAGLAGIGANNDAPVKAEAASITASTEFYLTPNNYWKQDNARYAIYFFGNGDAWVSMTKVEGETDLYTAKSPSDKAYTNLIFCRMNPSASANNWNNKWNQTADLTYDGTLNHYTVKASTWDKGGGTWSIWPEPEVVETHEVKYYVGEELIDTKTISEFESVAVTSDDPSKSFAGWATKDGVGYSDGSLVTADISVYATYVWTWSLCGTVSGGNWDNAVPLYYDAETQSYVSEELALTAGQEFKIRKDQDWGTSYGYAECTADKTLISNSGGNAKIVNTGTYVITFKANKWTIAEVVEAQNYTVNYYNDPNGDPIKTVEVPANGTAAIDFVYQENYSFLGWYLDAGLTQACSTAPTVAGDLNLYGKYVPCHDYTIYIKAASALNVYAWNNVNGQGNAAWPGAASTLIADGVYAYTIQGEYGYDKVIFNDGTGQTADLTLSASVYTVAADWNYTSVAATQVVAHIENDVIDLADVVPALGLDAGTHTATATSVGYSVISWNEGTLTLDSQAYAAKEEKQAALEAYMANVDTCNDYVNVASYNTLADGLDTTATVADVDYDWDGTREGDTYVIDSVRAWEADFLVTDDDNAQGHFTVSADFKAQIGYPNTQERLYGFVFYWDEGNWIQVYAKYDTTKSDRMTSVEINGCIGGHDPAHWTNWNTYWMHENWHLHDQGIEADPAKGFTLAVEYNNGVFVPSVDGFVNASYHNGTEWTSVCDLASRFPSDIWTQECKVGYLVLAGENNLVTVSDIDVTNLDGETVDTVHDFYKVKDSGAVVTITEYVDVQVSIQDKLDYMGALALEEANKESSKQNIYANPTTKGKGMAIMAIIGVAALVSIAAYYFLGKKKFAR